jgi:hypothetical protein
MQITRLDRRARLEYVARAVICGLLGCLALTTSSLASKGPEGEFELLTGIPGGGGASIAPPFICAAGRVGLGARIIVFAVISGSLLGAAWQENEQQVRDLGGALGALRDNQPLYLAVAAGLIIFAIYSAIETRFRIIPRVDPIAAGKRLAS